MNPRILTSALAGFLAIIPTLWADLPPAPQLLPADTLAMVTVPDWSRAAEQMSASSGGRLWADPAMRKFREHFAETLTTRLAGELAPLGIRPGDFLTLLQGQLTLAVLQDGWTGASGTEPGWVIVMDARGQSDQLRARIDTVRRQLVDGGRPVAEVTVRDRRFFRVDLPDSAGGDTAGGSPRQLHFGQVDTALVVSGTVPPLEKVLVRLGDGALAPLGDDEGFRTASATWFREAYAYGWARVPALYNGLVRTASEAGTEAAMPVDPSAALKALGLDALQHALFALRADRTGTAVDLNLGVPEGRRSGLFRILAPEPGDASPPPFVPAGAVKFQRWRIDLRGAWSTLETALQQAAPQLAGVVELLLATAGKDRDPNFDLRRSVVSQLGNDLVSYEMPPAPGAADPTAGPSLTLVGSPAPEALAAAMKTAASLLPGSAGAAPTPDRDFNGRTIHSVPMAPDGSGAPAKMEIGAAGGYVAMSGDPALLEGFLRSTEGSVRGLREDAALRTAAQRVGGTGTGLFGFENQRESVRRQWEFLRTGGLGKSAVALAAPDLGQMFRFDFLPPFDEVAQYFGIAVYAGQADAAGLNLRFFSPDPRP